MSSRTLLQFALPLLIVLAAAPGQGDAAILVPTDFATVDAAVAAASSGDTVLVAPGTYETNASVTVPLTILSTSGAGLTTLTGNGEHRVFDSVSADLTLEGFRITNGGDGNFPGQANGAGIRMTAPVTLVVENCEFTDNRGRAGVAIYNTGTLEVVNCLFEGNSDGNTFPQNVNQNGGAIYVAASASATITDSRFIANRGFTGGAFYVLGDLTVTGSEFRDNFANGDGGGIALRGSNATLDLSDSQFINNRGSEGGGLYVLSRSMIPVQDCYFEGNLGGQTGGAGYFDGDGPLVMERCQFIGNTATERGGGALNIRDMANGATIRFCFFKENISDEPIDACAGGGALYLSENGFEMGIDIEDCTFVANESRNGKGSVAAIEGHGSTSQFPRFLRCLIAYHGDETLFQCSFPNFCFGQSGSTDFGNFSLSCVLLHVNGNNFICTEEQNNVFPLLEEPLIPTFCDSNHDMVCQGSIADVAACGRIGGLDSCGLCTTPTLQSSWGQIKSMYHSPKPKGEPVVKNE